MALYLFDFDNLAVAGRCFVLIYANAVKCRALLHNVVRIIDPEALYYCLHCILRMWAPVLHRYDKCLFGRVTLIDRYNHGKIRVAIGFLEPRKVMHVNGAKAIMANSDDVIFHSCIGFVFFSIQIYAKLFALQNFLKKNARFSATFFR